MKAIEQYFNYLKEAGADVPSTADSFKKTLSDKTSAEQYYGYLKQNNFDAPDSFDSFAKTLGITKSPTVPVKKKDGSEPLSIDTPSVSGLNQEDPIPSVSALLKQRKKLKAEKSAVKPTAAPGYVYTPTVDYDSQISKLDEQIKSKGYDPLELERDWSDFEVDLTDDQFGEFYNNKKTKPITTQRDLASRSWHQSVRNSISNNQDETIRLENEARLNNLISQGSQLPSQDYNTALNFGRNAIQEIISLTSGEDRDKAIANFKKDFLPVFGNILLRDRKSIANIKDLPMELGLTVSDLFDKQYADQTRSLLTQDFSDNANAMKAKERRLVEVEDLGLSVLGSAVGQEYENNYGRLSEFDNWAKNNFDKFKDLGQKISSVDPEIKSVIDAMTLDINKENSALDAPQGELKTQEQAVQQAKKNFEDSRSQQSYDLYTGEVDKYNIMLDQFKSGDLATRSKNINELSKKIDDSIAKTGVSSADVKEYNKLLDEYNSFKDAAALGSNIASWGKYIKDKKDSKFKRYPTVEADRLMELEQEWDGESVGPVGRFISNIGSFADKAGDVLGIVYDSIFSSDEQKLKNDFERLGRSQRDSRFFNYEKESDRLYESPLTTVFSDDVKKKLTDIDDNDSLTEDQKRISKFDILRSGLKDGSIYQATNLTAGNINLTGKSVLNTITTVAPQILTSLGVAAATGGGATSLFVSTALQAYSEYYNEATRKGIANPNQYAMAHTLVEAGTELIGTTDLKMLQKAFQGKKGFGAKFFKDLSETELQSLMAGSKGAFKNYKQSVLKGVRSNVEEAGEEYLAGLGGNVINNELFGENNELTAGAGEAFISTFIGQLPLTAIGIPVSVNKNNIGSKYALYNAAADLGNTISVLKQEFDAGNLTKEQYTDRVKLVTQYANAIKESPRTYADGKPMRDDDRVKYAFNQFISNMKADKSPIPPQQKQNVDQAIVNAENENDKILSNATNQSQVQEGRTEGDLGQPQGTVQGQPEVGQGAGSQGQTQITPANVGDSNIDGQGQVAPPGKRLFNEPNPEAAVIETEFKASKGITTPEPAPITKLDEERSKKIADAYDQLVDNPNDPEVQAAYKAMADETMEQFGAIDKAGVKVEIWTGKGEPYKNSGEMIADVRDNKHMYIFSTEEGFGDTPITDEQRQQNALLNDSGIKDVNGKPLLINDIFRFVHDYFGHTRLGNSFGAIGEENAWNVHARMYSPLARRAMTTETRGQNSWVNFNSSYRNADGTMKKKGDEGYVPPSQRPFADQKMALLPEEFSNIEDSYSLKSAPTKIDQALSQSIPMVEKSLQDAGIKIQVVDAATDTEEARAARGNQGLFRSEDGTIIIDKSKLADEIEAGIVVWHEASHPVMNIIRNTDKPLYDAVVRGLKQAAKKNKGVAGALNWAQSQEQYDNEDTQNDEAVVETIGRINAGLIDINSLDTGLRQKLIDFVNSIAKYFGIDPILNDRDIAAFKKTVSEVADALKTGRDISEIVGKENVKNYGVPIGVPTQAKVADKYGPKVKHDGGTYKLSFVKPSDIIDIKGLIKEVADSGQKVWFWTADQLGRGMYYDNVIEGEHYLDAGPSFALDPKNRDNGIIWATGKGENWVNDKISNSDYIFIISGSPQKSKLFNKRVAEITFNRVKKAVGEEGAWDKFKSEVLGVSKIGKINEILNKYNSFEDLLASTDRKELLIQFDAQKEKKGTPLKGLLEKYGAFVDYNDLRDGFFKDNDFKLNDIMLVLKPTGYGGKSAHSTYENDILGEVVGVPDRKVNAYDIMPDEFRAKYAPDMSRTEQSQAVAPYGAGIRNVQASVGNRNLAPNGNPSNLTEQQYNQVRTPEFKNWFGDWENDPANASKVVDENGEPRVVYHGTNANFDEFKKEKLGDKNWMADSAYMGFFFAGDKKTSEAYTGMNSMDMAGVSFGLYDDIIDEYKPQVEKAKKDISEVYNRILKEESDKQNAKIRAIVEKSRQQLLDSGLSNETISSFIDSALQSRVDQEAISNLSQIENEKNGNTKKLEDINKIVWGKIEEKWKKKTGANPQIMELFLNIKNPLTVDYKDIEDTNLPSDIQEAIGTGKDGVIFNNLKDGAEADDIFVALEPNQIKSATANVGTFSTTDNRIQASVGNRSEADLRAEGTGKERPRALASKYGNLNPATQAKIEDDATVYFERTNKQTKEAVDKFLDGLNIMDAADYVLSNPKIPEVSQVWMAAEVAKRLNAEIDAAKDQDLIDDLTRKQADIFNEFAKRATSLGQAVQAFIAFKDNANAVEFFLPKVLRQLKKAGVENVTEEQRAEILTLLKDVNTAAEGLPKDKAIIKLSHYLAGIAPMSPMDVLQALWYAKILSGITTQSTNFFANIFNTVFELPAVALRISLMNGTPLGLAAGVKGFGSGVAKGAVAAADIIKSGVRSKEVDKYFAENPLEYFTWSKWLGNKGKALDYIPPLNFGAWKYVGRILAATDALFATANQEAIANMLAYAEAAGTPAGNNFKKANAILGNNKMSVLRARAQAKAEGFVPGTVQYKRRELEIISQKRSGTQEADEIGKRITMNYDPEGFTKPLFDAVVALQQRIPAIKMVIPFARIVANLTENGLNYSPFGFAKAATGIKNPFQGLKSERLSTEQRVDLFAKFAIGMSTLAAIAANVGEDDDDWFEITAGGSPDVQKKYELQKGGWRPYTITLKDGTKISYKDWPIAGILAGVGHIRDAKKYSFDDSTQMGLYSYGFFLNMYDKSLLSGLQDFFGIFNVSAGRGKYAPDSKGMDRATKYAAQQVKSVALSNLSQQTFKLYSELVTGDPQRDAKTFAQVIYRDIPSFNDGIRPIIDVFGDEVKYTTTERLLPVMDSPEKEEIIEWLNNNKLFVGVPMKKNIKLLDGTERPMTDDEYYEYRKNAGKGVKKLIMEFMSEIKDKEIGEEAFEKVVNAARQEAYGEILMKANNL